MARASKFEITLDALDLDAEADRLGAIDARDFGTVAVVTVNQAAASTREDAKRTILSGVNLSDQYVDERLRLDEATDPAKPVASIVSPARNTTLASYGALQLAQPVRWTNAWIAENKKPVGPWPKWTPRTGRPSSGIKADFKQAGVQVEVLKGAPKAISYAFVIQKGGRPVVLKRTKGDRLVGAQGPAVYQMFRHALDAQFLQRVSDDLGRMLLQNTTRIL